MTAKCKYKHLYVFIKIRKLNYIMNGKSRVAKAGEKEEGKEIQEERQKKVKKEKC